MIAEEWREIKDFGGLLEVSSLGNVRFKETQKVIRAHKSSNGYLQIKFRFDGKVRQPLLHRLVLSGFAAQPSEAHCQVNHKNGDKEDNRVENLEWATPSQNIRHRFQVLCKGNLKGEKNGQAKLTDAQVLEILRKVKIEGAKRKEVAEEFGVSLSAVYFICTGRNWASVSSKFFAELEERKVA